MKARVALALRVGAAALVASVALAACNTAADVTVEISEDGSGTVSVAVELDSEAASAIGGTDALALGDLEDTGWELSGPDVTDSDGLVLSASHRFADQGELAAVLDAVAGPGVFTDVSIDIEEGIGSTEWNAGITVAVSGDPSQFSDDELTAVLSGLPLGRTPEELAEVGATTPGAATMSVDVSLFGEDSDSTELDLTAGEPGSATLSVEHSESQMLVYVLAAVAGFLVVFAVVFAVLALRSARRR